MFFAPSPYLCTIEIKSFSIMTSAKILLAILFGFILCLIIVLVVMAFRTLRRRHNDAL